jgi:hypothetical protein
VDLKFGASRLWRPKPAVVISIKIHRGTVIDPYGKLLRKRQKTENHRILVGTGGACAWFENNIFASEYQGQLGSSGNIVVVNL